MFLLTVMFGNLVISCFVSVSTFLYVGFLLILLLCVFIILQTRVINLISVQSHAHTMNKSPNHLHVVLTTLGIVLAVLQMSMPR